MNDVDVKELVRAVKDMSAEIKLMRDDVRSLTKAVRLYVDDTEVKVN